VISLLVARLLALPGWFARAGGYWGGVFLRIVGNFFGSSGIKPEVRDTDV
jgi:hypothetical protein